MSDQSAIWSYYDKKSNRWQENYCELGSVDYSDPVGTAKNFLLNEIKDFATPREYPAKDNLLLAAFGLGNRDLEGCILKAGGDKLEGSLSDFIGGGFDLLPKVEVEGAITVTENRLPFRGMGPEHHIVATGLLRFAYSLEYLGKVGPKKYHYDCPIYYRIKTEPRIVPWIMVTGPRNHDVMKRIPKPFTSYGHNAEAAAKEAYKYVVENTKTIGALNRHEKMQEIHKIIDRLLELEIMGVEFDPKESPLEKARGEHSYYFDKPRVEIEATLLLDRYKELTGGKTPKFLEESIGKIAGFITDHPDIMGR